MAKFTIQKVKTDKVDWCIDECFYRQDTKSFYNSFYDASVNSREFHNRTILDTLETVEIIEYRDESNSVCRDIKYLPDRCNYE